jgi:hypothetical protein
MLLGLPRLVLSALSRLSALSVLPGLSALSGLSGLSVCRRGLRRAAEVDAQLSAVDLLGLEDLLGRLSTGHVDEVGMAETSGLT